jgi:hypothetical protein
MTRNKLLAALTAVFILISVPMFAHHGTGISYDNSKFIKTKATVTDFSFANPHVRIFFDTTDEKGKVTKWSGEMANPAQFLRAGWTKRRLEKELQPGTQMDVTFYVSRAQEQLPSGVGAALVVRMFNAKGEQIGLDRGGAGAAPGVGGGQ